MTRNIHTRVEWRCLKLLRPFPKTPLSTIVLNIQFKGAPSPESLAGCLGTLPRDPEVAMPRVAACTDEMFPTSKHFFQNVLRDLLPGRHVALACK